MDINEKEVTETKQTEIEKEKPKGGWYDRHYKKLLFVSLGILVLSLSWIAIFYFKHHDFMLKDVSLSGGTVVTIYTEQKVNPEQLALQLEKLTGYSSNSRILEDIATRRQLAIVVETKANETVAKQTLEQLLGFQLNSENSSFEVTGPLLGETFYRQILLALLIAFCFMAFVVFLLFKQPIPSLAIVLAAFTDLVGALAIANLFGFKISTAGISAFLMLVGYSIDTDIMLTTRVLKRRGEASLNSRIWTAAKTGLAMTLTSLCAVLVAFFVAQSSTLKQIFFILSAGLFVDLISTWFGNASILKWWCEKKGIK